MTDRILTTDVENSHQIEGVINVAKKLNLIGLMDHGGRAGSNFVQCLFDRHTEVISCPLVHYVYSYWITLFGDNDTISSADALEFVNKSSYFRFIYNKPDKINSAFIKKIGGNEKVSFHFERYQSLVDTYLDMCTTVTRKEFLSVLYVLYAFVQGKDIKLLKYFLINDAVSLRDENVFTGFSAKTIDTMRVDYPLSWIVFLVRDPRAQFASTRHQLVNEFGNNYSITVTSFFKRLKDLLADRITMDFGPAHLISYMYQCASAKAAFERCYASDKFTIILRNEDINLCFIPTMKSLSTKIGFAVAPEWYEPDYVPTMMDCEWKGTGAYSNRYQKETNGPLKNDSNEVVEKAIGPNRHVTERWKKRMPRWEIELSERLFRDEIKLLGYKVYYDDERHSDIACLMRTAWLPASGEFPLPAWIYAARKDGVLCILNRLVYTMLFPVFYLLARIKLFRYVLRDKFFKNIVVTGINEDTMINPDNCDNDNKVTVNG